eukprot:TRINITY_DN1951_c0_g1_i2.p1 TRINITY_DN1951_c0_g1~~TRINITY_DN1951_c0_g1_i2.p1  ORF type:complete len:503 (+),score=49.64 TRINITY_DN1951_c0_g1_i2:92-1510(+)
MLRSLVGSEMCIRDRTPTPPTVSPTSAPTEAPTGAPTNSPTPPTHAPSSSPTVSPSASPTGAPSDDSDDDLPPILTIVLSTLGFCVPCVFCCCCIFFVLRRKRKKVRAARKDESSDSDSDSDCDDDDDSRKRRKPRREEAFTEKKHQMKQDVLYSNEGASITLNDIRSRRSSLRQRRGSLEALEEDMPSVPGTVVPDDKMDFEHDRNRRGSASSDKSYIGVEMGMIDMNGRPRRSSWTSDPDLHPGSPMGAARGRRSSVESLCSVASVGSQNSVLGVPVVTGSVVEPFPEYPRLPTMGPPPPTHRSGASTHRSGASTHRSGASTHRSGASTHRSAPPTRGPAPPDIGDTGSPPHRPSDNRTAAAPPVGLPQHRPILERQGSTLTHVLGSGATQDDIGSPWPGQHPDPRPNRNDNRTEASPTHLKDTLSRVRFGRAPPGRRSSGSGHCWDMIRKLPKKPPFTWNQRKTPRKKG